MQFRYISHKEIDKALWDDAINRAINGMPYAYSWYLDIVCPGWAALASENYEMIFPLAQRRKYGIKYLFQPFFVPYFDVYSRDIIGSNEMKQLLNLITKRFPFIEINVLQVSYDPADDIQVTERKAQHIDLSQEFSISHSLKQNLSKAAKAGIHKTCNIQANVFISNTKKELANKIKEFGNREYEMLREIIKESEARKAGFTIGVQDDAGSYFGGCFFLKSDKFVLLMKSFTSSEGKKNGSMSFLRNSVIHSFKGQKLIFDFAGSNMPGVAEYNKYFGAKDYPYYAMKHNALPWPIRLFKK